MEHSRTTRAANQEIERKFLVRTEVLRPLLEKSQGTRYAQGYLCAEPDRTVRVRVAGQEAFLTIKGRTHGCTRAEYEYPIPVRDAENMLGTLCPLPLVEKVRYRIPAKEPGLVWEIDEFQGENAPLVLAEIELPSADTSFERPPWLAQEVTNDERYYNAMLQKHPYRLWGLDPETS
jgi:adenylate cyclase